VVEGKFVKCATLGCPNRFFQLASQTEELLYCADCVVKNAKNDEIIRGSAVGGG
jgi:hypothetical protein